MLEIALIETGISILEKLTGLLKLSHASKQEQFDKLSNPIFEDMKSIHKNYLHMFVKAKRTLEASQDVSKIAELLEEDRIELSAIRSSTVSIAYALSRKNHLKRYKSFLVSISDYFDAYNHNYDQIERKIEGGTVATTFLEKLNSSEVSNASEQSKAKKKKAIQDTLEELSKIIVVLEDRWRKVSNNYAELMSENI